MSTILGNGNITFGDATVQNTAANKVTITKILRGYHNFFAQTSDNKVYSWGYCQADGYLGQGTTAPSLSTEIIFPGETGTISDLVILASSCYCLFSTGNLYAWGYNGYGQLGLGNTTSYSSPMLTATGVTNIYYPKNCTLEAAHVTAAFFMIIKSSNGNFYAAGYGGEGNFGDGTTTNRNSWSVLAPPAGKTIANVWTSTYPGGCTFIKTTDNLIYGAGSNSKGNLGIGNSTQQNSWVQITFFNTITDVIDIQAGGWQLNAPQTVSNNYNSTTVLTASGNIYTCGANDSGQLGDGTRTLRSTFAQVSLTKAVSKLVRGPLFVYVIFTDNTYAKWGYSGNGQCANGTTTDSISPIYSSSTCTNIFIASPSQYNHQYSGVFILKSTGLYFCGAVNYNSGNPALGAGDVLNETLIQINNIDILDIKTTASSDGSGLSSIVAFNNSGLILGCGRNLEGEMNAYYPSISTAKAFRSIFDANEYR